MEKQELELLTTPTDEALLVWVHEVSRHYLLTGKEDTNDLVTALGHCRHLHATTTASILRKGDYCLHREKAWYLSSEDAATQANSDNSPKIVFTTDPSIRTLATISNEVIEAFCKGTTLVEFPIYEKNIYTRGEVVKLINKQRVDGYSDSLFYQQHSQLTSREFHALWLEEHLT